MGDGTPNPADLRELQRSIHDARRAIEATEAVASRLTSDRPNACWICGNTGDGRLCEICESRIFDHAVSGRFASSCTQRMSSRVGICGRPSISPYNLCGRHYEEIVGQAQFSIKGRDGLFPSSVAYPLIEGMSDEVIEKECERRGIRRPILTVKQAAPAPQPERVSYVYACTHGEPGRGDPIKVGISVDPIGRMKALGHAKLLGVEFGGRERESELHGRFADHRQVGEWFAPAPLLMEWVATLSDPDELIGEAA